MSWETVIEKRLYDAVDEKIVHNGSCWVQETYIKGEHPWIGQVIAGQTGTETIQRIIIPESLVNPNIKVNGESNAILQHRVAPEFRDLIPPIQPTMAPLERLLEGVEFDLISQPQEPVTQAA